MQYDKLGRLAMIADSNGRTLGYEYDALGNRTAMITPDGKKVKYTYDSVNRLTGIESWAGEIAFGYDRVGRRTSLHYPNGVVTGYEYDQPGNLTRIMAKNSKDDIVAAFTYEHDQIGNRLSKAMPDIRYDYDYDEIYRLLESAPVKINKKGKEIKDRHNTEEFSYDPAGNRLSGPDRRDGYDYDYGNQLLESRKYDFRYDENGNLIEKTAIDDESSWTYEYDYENRLIRATKLEADETKIVTFKYDPFNRRIEKKVEELESDGFDSKTTTYVYDGANLVIEIETDDDVKGKGKEKASRYLYGLGTSEPLVIDQKGEVYYYHLDGLNTPASLTDKKGRVVVSYEYSAFGERKRYGNHVKQNLVFPGQYYDEETGLHYNWHRYYDPATGRYLTPDPIGLRGGVNLFLYVQGNPVNYIDFTGLLCGSGWNDPIVPDTFWGQYDFSEPCEWHDQCYGRCSDDPGHKSFCDEGFRDRMLRECESLTGLMRTNCEANARSYYNAVRTMGGGAYSSAQDSDCQCSGSW
jgi:RHS repeat-associated protein